MKIHEYQAKEILKKYNVAVPDGQVAFSPAEAYKIAEQLGGTVVVKAQIHAQAIIGLKRQPDARRHCVVVTQIGAGAGTGITKKGQLICITV